MQEDLDRARRLADLDRTDEAREAYLQLLARAPDDLRALNDFGTFLMRGGYRAAARTVYERALAIDPQSALAHANLANVLFADTAYDGARAHYEAALAIEPHNAAAHQGLSYALTRLGRDDEALVHRRLGFTGRALTTAPYRGAGRPVDVLLCVCAGGGTLYTDTFLDDRIFRVTTLVADVYDGTPALPSVDVVFNAISDADRAGAALTAVAAAFGAERATADQCARARSGHRARRWCRTVGRDRRRRRAPHRDGAAGSAAQFAGRHRRAARLRVPAARARTGISHRTAFRAASRAPANLAPRSPGFPAPTRS